MKVFVTGHSHLGAFFIGVDHLRLIDQNFSHQVEYLLMLDPEYSPWGTWVDGEVQFNAHLIKSLERKITQFNPDIVVATIDGAMHFIHGTLNHAQPFDFFDKISEPKFGVNLVPHALVRAFYAVDVTQVMKILRPMKLVAPASKFYYIAPPPPLEDEALMLPHLNVWADAIRDHGFARPEFRLRMWRAYMEVLEEAATSHGFHFLYPPATTLTPAGYLKPEFQADVVHANAHYAIEVLAQLEQEQLKARDER